MATSQHEETYTSLVDTEPTTTSVTRPVATIILSDSSPTTDPTKQSLTSMENMTSVNTVLIDEDSNQTRASANLDSTARSLITNPDATELETANVLLHLGNLGEVGSEQQNQLDVNYDISDLLPVDAALLEDFA